MKFINYTGDYSLTAGVVYDPVTAIVGGLGLGLQVMGMSKAEKAAEKQAEQQTKLAELQERRVREQAMREQRKRYREMQIARAEATSAGTNAGATIDGSALQGALGASKTEFGVFQNDLRTDVAMFGAETQAKTGLAYAQADASSAAGMQNFGRALTGNAKGISSIFSAAAGTMAG